MRSNGFVKRGESMNDETLGIRDWHTERYENVRMPATANFALTVPSPVLLFSSCMSARRVDVSSSLNQQVTVEARQTRLSLSPNAVIIHKNGIEFRSST